MLPPQEDTVPPPAHDEGEPPAEQFYAGRSLLEDVSALIDDGRTYLEAELNYQKSRAAYVADEAKEAAVYGAVGGALAFLALVGLTVGLIIALTPWLTAWGASVLVVGLLGLGAYLFLRAASRRWNRLLNALGSNREEDQ